MLNEFTRSYIGFQEKEKVGSIFTHEDEEWVIIKILNTKLILSSSPVIYLNLIAQKINSNREYTDFTNSNTITNKIPIAGKTRKDIKIKTLGEVIQLKDKSTGGTALAIVSGIDGFTYKQTDLVITYTIEHIIPWTQKEIDDIVHSHRMSTFKVIQGGKEGGPPSLLKHKIPPEKY